MKKQYLLPTIMLFCATQLKASSFFDLNKWEQRLNTAEKYVNKVTSPSIEDHEKLVKQHNNLVKDVENNRKSLLICSFVLICWSAFSVFNWFRSFFHWIFSPRPARRKKR